LHARFAALVRNVNFMLMNMPARSVSTGSYKVTVGGCCLVQSTVSPELHSSAHFHEIWLL